jgi:imidazolonepropionase
VTCAGPSPRRGPDQRGVSAIPDGAIVAAGEHLVFAGATSDLPAHLDTSAAHVFDVPDASIVPGFVDPHTHAVFAGDRRDELRRRLAGESYAAIAASGGGIVATVSATRAATEDDLVRTAAPRLAEMLAAGTTTCEIKSGYGLDLPSELKMLRAMTRLGDTQPIDITRTFLGAHETPLEHRSSRSTYVRVVIDEMIPAVAEAGLAEWCDVFCETGVFTPDESAAILEAGARAGLKPRIHADELGPSGGSRVAAAVGARSADHLVFVGPEGIAAMARANVAATLLPCAAFYLKLGGFAPARALVDGGVAVALATDVNPGGGFSPSMPFAMAVACFSMNMTFEEALVAATINAAWTLDRADVVGSLEPGKLADAVIVRGDAIDLIRIGAPSIRAVIKRGTIVSGSLSS